MRDNLKAEILELADYSPISYYDVLAKGFNDRGEADPIVHVYKAFEELLEEGKLFKKKVGHGFVYVNKIVN